jgi:hypothetical protein
MAESETTQSSPAEKVTVGVPERQIADIYLHLRRAAFPQVLFSKDMDSMRDKADQIVFNNLHYLLNEVESIMMHSGMQKAMSDIKDET